MKIKAKSVLYSESSVTILMGTCGLLNACLQCFVTPWSDRVDRLLPEGDSPEVCEECDA